MKTVDISTEGGDVQITEQDLPLSDEDLSRLRISRDDFNRVWEEAAELMRGVEPGARMRAVADQALDGAWHVFRCRYSPINDPLMQGERSESKS